MKHTIDSDTDSYFIRDSSGKIVADLITTREEAERVRESLDRVARSSPVASDAEHGGPRA